MSTTSCHPLPSGTRWVSKGKKTVATIVVLCVAACLACTAKGYDSPDNTKWNIRTLLDQQPIVSMTVKAPGVSDGNTAVFVYRTLCCLGSIDIVTLVKTTTASPYYSTCTCTTPSFGAAPYNLGTMTAIAYDATRQRIITLNEENYIGALDWGGSSYTASLFAGAVGTPGDATGAATAARFTTPSSMVVLPDDSAYVIVDSGSSRIAKVLATDGTTSNYMDGMGASSCNLGGAASIFGGMGNINSVDIDERGERFWLSSEDTDTVAVFDIAADTLTAVTGYCGLGGSTRDGREGFVLFNNPITVAYVPQTRQLLTYDMDTSIRVTDPIKKWTFTLAHMTGSGDAVEGRIGGLGVVSVGAYKHLSPNPFGTITLTGWSGALLEMYLGKLVGRYLLGGGAGRKCYYSTSGDLVAGAGITDGEDHLGLDGGAAAFDGTNNAYFQVPFLLTRDLVMYTICVWIYVPSTSSSFSVYGRESTQSSNVEYQFHSGASGMRLVSHGVTLQTGHIPAAGTWEHHCWQREGPELRVFVNGRRKGVVAGVATMQTSHHDDGTDRHIGSFGTVYYQGRMTDIRFYNYGLFREEIKALYWEAGV